MRERRDEEKFDDMLDFAARLPAVRLTAKRLLAADGLSRDDPRVPSVTFLWKGAEWMEREAYDMFGITFEGNRDLRRIYMPPDYTSFPLPGRHESVRENARSVGI